MINQDFKAQQNAPALVHFTSGGKAEDIGKEQKFAQAIAQQINASLYFVEHRFFGDSLPPNFGNAFTYDKIKDIGHENALDDFKKVLADIRQTDNNLKIIVSGSEYAGELAMLLRKDTTNNIFGYFIDLYASN